MGDDLPNARNAFSDGIVGAFVHNSKEFLRWYRSATPEFDLLPAEWEKNCNKL